MELSQKLKQLRKKQGLTQLELAEKLFVSRQAITGWEAGSSRPSTENLKSLGALYDIPLEYLLNEEAPEPSEIITTDTGIKNGIAASRKISWQQILKVIVFFIVIVVVVTWIYVHNTQKEGERVVPIEEMTDDANWGESEADQFSLDW